MLAALQDSVRRFDKESNVVSWMEPHGEIAQAGDDFLGYGPAADAVFRDYLRTQYAGPDKVGAAWLGNPAAFKSWDDIHAPELADFLAGARMRSISPERGKSIIPTPRRRPTCWRRPLMTPSG